MRKTGLQATFILDPLNRSGHARDGNEGVILTRPILDFQEVIERFGTATPVIEQPTRLHFLSGSPLDGSSPIRFSPTLVSGGSLRITGDLGPDQNVGSGVLGVVTSKDRPGGVLLAADLSSVPGVAPGMMIANTTPGKASRSTVLRSTGMPGVFELSQPMSISDDWPNTGDPVQVDTWGPGDPFDVFVRDLVDVVELDPIVADFDVNNSNFTVIERVGILQVPGATGPEAVYLGDALALVDVHVQRRLVTLRSASGKNTLAFNCALDGGMVGGNVTDHGAGNGLWMFGGYTVGLGLIGGLIDLDAIVLARGRCHSTRIGSVFVDAGVTLTVDGQSTIAPGELAEAMVWGPGAVDVVGRLVVTQPAATQLLQTGGLTINGQTQAFSGSRSTPSVIDGAAMISPTGVDASPTGLWIPGGGGIAAF